MASSNVSSQETEDLFEEGKRLSEKLLDLLQKSIQERHKMAMSLCSIADDLDNVKGNVNVAKIAGGAVAVVGGAVGIVACILTAGAALPIVAAAGASVAGLVTKVTADLIGQKVSKPKLEKAQTILTKDNEITEKIKEVYGKMENIAYTLSRLFEISEDQMVGLLILGRQNYSSFGQIDFLHGVLRASMLPAIAIETGITGFSISVGKSITTAVTKISSRALSVVLLGGAVIWDAIDLITTIAETAKGSPTEAAKELRSAAKKIEDSVSDIEKNLEEQRKFADELKTKLMKRFMDLIDKVSTTQSATTEEQQEILNYLQNFATEDWINAIKKLDLLKTILPLADNIRYWKSILEKNRKKIMSGNELTITFIAHASLSYVERRPVNLYYMNSYLKNICLYSPWGSAIDAQVVYGIATRLLRPQNRRFLSNPPGPFHPNFYSNIFNDLPRSGVSIPTPMLFPIRQSDPAYQGLIRVNDFLQARCDDLVVIYIENLIPLPQVHLWVITAAFALLGAMFKISIKFNYAACLSWDEETPRSLDWRDPQYCYVGPKKPPERMTCTLPIPLRQEVGDLNQLYLR